MLTLTLDDAGRPTSLAGYASAISYAAHGAVRSFTLGNALIESTSFNSRLQPTLMQLGTSSSAGSVWQLENIYPSTANNDNLAEQKLTLPLTGWTGGVSTVYRYDAVNRVSLASERPASLASPVCPDAGSHWCRAYGYDERGNRLVTAQTNTGLSLNNPTAFNASNQIAGGTWEYGDERGNVTKDATSATMLYDAENRLVAYCGSGPSPCPNSAGAGRTLFQYDGEGRRVRRDSPASSSVYVYDALGQLAAEYGGTAAAVGRTYLTQDHLGSTRVVTDASQNATVRRDYLPFGEEVDATVANERWGLAGYGNDGGVAIKFTGKERDVETGLDYFGARYMSSVQGRFTGPDPFLPMIEFQPESDDEEDIEEARENLAHPGT